MSQIKIEIDPIMATSGGRTDSPAWSCLEDEATGDLTIFVENQEMYDRAVELLHRPKPQRREPHVPMYISGPGCHHIGERGASVDIGRTCENCNDFAEEVHWYGGCNYCGARFHADRQHRPFHWVWPDQGPLELACEACYFALLIGGTGAGLAIVAEPAG